MRRQLFAGRESGNWGRWEAESWGPAGKLSTIESFQMKDFCAWCVKTYRFGAFFFLLTKLLRFVIFLAFIYFLATKTKRLAGYSANQAIFIYLTFNVSDTLAQMLFREVYRFKNTVVYGGLNSILVKPFNPLIRVLLGGVDFFDMIMFVLYITLVIWQVVVFKGVTVISVLLYLALVFNGLIIAGALHIVVLALTVITAQTDQLIMVYRNLTSTGRFPLTIYKSEIVRMFFTFIIPVGLMVHYPSKVIFGILSPINIVIAFVFSALLFKLSLWLWRYSLSLYQSWGG